MFFQPSQQRRAEIKAYIAVVVDDLHDTSLLVQDTGGGIGLVALDGNAFVPIMIRISRILQFDGLQPGIFPWRLVEVAVNANIAIVCHVSPFFLNGCLYRFQVFHRRRISPAVARQSNR